VYRQSTAKDSSQLLAPKPSRKSCEKKQNFGSVSTLWASSGCKDPSEAAKARTKEGPSSDVVKNRPERLEQTRSCNRKFASKVQSKGSNCSTHKKNNIVPTYQEFMRTMIVSSCKDQQT
jgi:hypothetical protein